MENQYVYTKKRSEFGRQCCFSDHGPTNIDNLLPNRALMDEYILRDPVHRGVQCSKRFAEHELNTIRAEYDQHSMNHAEGGWPKDINPLDIEQTMRFRKKVEKDEMYIHTVLQLSHPMEHCIFQNNAVNIYELYFADEEQSALVERSKSRTVNVFRDPSVHKRPVHHLSWSPDGGTRLAVTHCNLEFQRAPADLSTHSYIWQVENPNKPELVLQPTVPIVCLEYNPKDPHSLVSGLHNGQVAFWDTRRGGDPVELSSLANSHRDPTHQVLWINSKSGTEFFSASSDGQVKWWDVRKLSEPMETLILNMTEGEEQSLNRALGASCLEYEPTITTRFMVKWWDVRKLSEPMETLILDMTKGEEQSLNRALGASCLEYEPTIPTRFMIGTENGIVIAGNRKGKTPLEKLGATYKTHHGPVYALQRNPAFVKNFLTIGDWTARIWSEDCKESSIIWTSYHRSLLTSGSWSPTRYSVFYTTRMDGTVDAWDILQNQREACLSVKVCDEPLRCLRCHEFGELVAVGNDRGTAYLVEFSENLAVSAKNDKSLLTAMFERESRREKIIEGKMREIRLRVKTRQSEAHSAGSRESRPSVTHPSAADVLLQTAEEEFFQIIEEEEAKALGKEPEVPTSVAEEGEEGKEGQPEPPPAQ